jgi:hypothetical protein
MIDRCANAGLSFSGAAPDLGADERWTTAMVVRERLLVLFHCVMGVKPVEMVEREESILAAHRDGF